MAAMIRTIAKRRCARINFAQSQVDAGIGIPALPISARRYVSE
jgi:hypothetical protein